MFRPVKIFGSVCSGIEAASVAWGTLGWRAVWLSEIEPFPCAVLKHHYPEVPNLGDMVALPQRILAGEVEAPDLFTGGTPCQAFSVAGLRKSLDDARGNLSLTFCEIANAIDHVRVARGDDPCVVFWENVPGVLNTKDNAFGCFLAGLAGEADALEPPGGKWTNAGYVSGPKRAVAWRVLDAQYFGVAQRRRRVFVVASAGDGLDPAEVLFEFDGVRRDSAPSREAGQSAARGTAGGVGVGQPYTVANCLTARMHKGINSTLDEGQTPIVTHSLRGEGFDAMQVRRLTPTECERLQGFPTVSEKVIIEACLDLQNQGVRAALKCLKWQNSAWPADASGSLPNATTAANHSSTHQVGHAPLAALHVQLHYGHEVQAVHSHGRLIWSASGAGASEKSPLPTPDGNTAAELARLLHEVVKTAGHGKAESPPSISLSFPASSGATSAEKSGHATAASASGAESAQTLDTFTTSDLGRITTCSDSTAETLCCSVLRAIAGCIPSETLPATFSIELTVESPYTAIPWRGKPADQCPDGPRYKALGNSWAVPVVRWIGERIDARWYRRSQ